MSQDNVAANVLQLAVGTANIYGDIAGTGNSFTGTNVVATYRQGPGSFAVGDSILVDTPSLTGPFTLAAAAGKSSTLDALSTVLSGPAPTEIGTATITATPQGGTAVTSLGTSGGVSGLGIEPFNYNNQNGTPATVTPYPVPLYDSLAADANTFVPWGGPPAFDPNRDGQGVRDGSVVPGGTLGISEGLDVLANVVPSTASAYTLSAPSLGTSAGNVAPAPAIFSLKSTALLPAATPPVPTLDGTGGGSFAVALPAGVTEGYVQVTDIGPPQPTAASGLPAVPGCNAFPVYYTIFVTASGTATLGPTSGNGGAPSLCTSAQNTTANSAPTDGDQFTVQLIGFDYPAYEASYPNSSGNPRPVLLGAAGQTDITISSAATYAQPAAGGLIRIATHKRSVLQTRYRR